MPLVRFEVRKEVGLANPELYRRGGSSSDDDPKAVLDGVAVAGLIGILRQLGDLADFAEEVFRGLQEQVIVTATRSHKLMVRAQHIEDVLPSMEKAIFTQSSHMHFAYTAGCDWHTRVPCEENHFIDSDLPRFIMDSYEECHDPPRLHMLDKFDTSGPGSCLKRYSDPTFFRRTSKNFMDVNVDKVKTDKKKQKYKKRKSTSSTRHLLQGGSLSNRSGRMQFTSPIIDGRTSTTASIVDICLKSDHGDCPNLLRSKSKSGYIEHAVESSHSTQSKEEKSWASSSYDLKPHDDIIDSASVCKGARGIDDKFPQEIFEESMASHSASVTWEEKTEILEPNNERDMDKDLITTSTNFNMGAPEEESKEINNVKVVKVMCDDDNISNSICYGNLADGFNSEPENFVDALNNMESESENDLNCQTKREVKQCLSEVQKNDTQSTLHNVQMHEADSHYLPTVQSDKSADVSSSRGIPAENPTETSSMHSFHDRVACVDDESLNLQDSAGPAGSMDHKVVDAEVQSATCSLEPVSPKSHDKIKNESSADLTGVKLWTNGGLLGLEPSKPPDFALSNKVNQGPEINNISEPCYNAKEETEGGRYSENVVIRDNQDRLNHATTSSADDQGDKISNERQKLVSSFDVSTTSHNPSRVRLLNSLFTQGSKMPVSLPVGTTKSDSTQENGDTVSGVFGLGHRLLVNSFLKRQSSLHDDKVESIRSAKAGELDLSPRKDRNISQKIPESPLTLQSQGQSPSKSWPPSPPLEHMKISFHPVCSFEKPKMKLKFLDKDSSHESTKDMFSSFQLVPESTSPLHDLGSDFEDTFGRSSPSLSDDWSNHQSESDSEQWDSDEKGESKGHEICDAVRTITLTESGASSWEPGIIVNDASSIHAEVGNACFENALKNPSVSTSSLDLPCYDSVCDPLGKETSGALNIMSQPEVELQMKPAPPPPPLPPVKLGPLKSLPDEMKDGLQVGSEGTDTGESSNLHGPTISVPTPAISGDSHLSEKYSKITMERESDNHQDFLSCPQKVFDQVANGTGLNEREDFLNQIRTKSFSLRSTATTSSSPKQGPTTNVKVTAILEKATAMRQVVGSDDDAWSDT